MEGIALTENKPLPRLATGRGLAVTSDPEDPTVRICRLRLDDAWPRPRRERRDSVATPAPRGIRSRPM